MKNLFKKTAAKSVETTDKRRRITSAQVIPVSFLIVILAGTLLLLLPFSTAEGEHTDFLTALFTSTTSVCVTGLVVVDTYLHWTLFGKIVILILIQLGGLGMISVTSIIMLIAHKKFSLGMTVMLHDSFNLNSLSGLMRFLVRVFKGTLIVEGLGALLYMPVFIPEFGIVKGIWYSIFTSISAFCNAGIDIIGPDSLIGYNSNPAVMFTTILMIVMGGLGYIVWFDILSGFRYGIKQRFSLVQIYKRFSEHTKLVLTLTLILIFGGAAVIFLTEYSNPLTIGEMPLGDKILNSVFQSVTFRTAGFASVPQQFLREGTCAFGDILMFIGGSPVGTAGGIKTVTFFAVILNAVSYIRNRNEAVVYNRRFSPDTIRKAAAVMTVSFFVSFVMLFLLMISSDVSLTDGLFEVLSATCTVGLTRGLTPTLGIAGRIIIIISMYLGRIGPISMALFFTSKRNDKNKVKHIAGGFIVG
ncbi:MAG: potassium transporter TrkH [Ruminiclostridium sp.]|nr:potassium transporter TrkH [Ruminiclostridium sp.]